MNLNSVDSPISPIIRPTAPTSAAPAPAAPSAPAAAPSSDRNLVRDMLDRTLDFGALPWDLAGRAPAPQQAPKAPAAFTKSESFNKLSAADQQTVQTLFDTASRSVDDTKLGEIEQDVQTLLESGKLSQNDTFGKSAVGYLETFNQSPLHDSLSGTSKAELAQDLLKALANPESVKQSQSLDDCAEATMEATLAYSHPADFVRISTELATKGEASIPGGPKGPNPDTLKLSTSGSRDGRSALGSMMQDSFGKHVTSIFQGILSAIVSLGGDKGLNANQVKSLYDGVLGTDHVTVFAKKGENLLPTIQEELAKQNTENPSVKVSMRNQEGYLHSMSVTGISGDSVSLWDPRSGERTTMSSEEFNSLAARAMIERSAPKSGLVDGIVEAISSPIKTITEVVDSLTEEGGGRLGGRGQDG
ncbi:hypothetical protein J7643_11755 [bacterium]|nr:hypothetical protein [bacterium]